MIPIQKKDYVEFLKNKGIKYNPVGFKPENLPFLLFDWQRDIVNWAVHKGKGAIWADCGLGKTAMQLSWAEQVFKHTGKDILILAPLTVAQQTKQEGEKFGIGAVTVCRTQSDVRTGINITNYEMLHHFNPNHFVGIVLDESGCLKAFDSVTRNQLIQAFSNTPYRLACTATPSPNDYMELGNHAEFLGIMKYAEMLATFFVHDGGHTSKWKLKGHAEKDFWKWVSSWGIMLRKPSDLNYDNDGFVLPELRLTHHKVLAKILKKGFFSIPNQSMIESRKTRRVSIDDRVELCAELVNSSKEAWIIWCGLNEESKKATEAIPDAIEIKGEDSLKHKEETILAFCQGKVRVLVTKASIVGWGLNLQHCHNQVFLGIDFSFESYYQAVRRCWRFGQKHSVDVHLIVTNQDGSVLKAIQRKEEDFNQMANKMTFSMKDMAIEEIKMSGREEMEYETNIAEGVGWENHLGDCVEETEKMENDSVGFSVFSPPFAQLYSYSNSTRDMGNSKDYKEFFNHFRFLIKQLIRITSSGRLCAVHCMNLPVFKYRDGYIGLRDFRGDIIRAFESEKWIYSSEICIWKNPVIAMQRTKAIGLLYKQLKKDSVLSRQGIPDYVVVFRKPGENKESVEHKPDRFPLDTWQRWASPIWMDINPSETLQKESAREEKDEKHIAPLQLEVIKRCITLWSNPNDLVLSPFSGIGSEGFVAVKMGRRFKGIELKKSYWKQGNLNLKKAEIEYKKVGTRFFTTPLSKKFDGDIVDKAD